MINISMETVFYALLGIPIASSIVIWALARGQNRVFLYLLHTVATIATATAGLVAISFVIGGERYTAFNDMLLFDSISGVFVTVISVVGLFINLYSIRYFSWEMDKGVTSFRDARTFFSLSHLFAFTMLLSVTANNIALLWVAIEATTLSSVFLVALYRNKKATEGGWKYIVICSIGLAFALYGTILLYSSSYEVIGDAHQAMLWTSLMDHAQELHPDMLKIIFVFMVIGFGTKAGLAPMHTWLPDAHAEAPSPASAMLSDILLKCSIAAIIRYYAVIGRSPVGFEYVQIIMLIVGLLSIVIASLFILRQHDIKRMFAYHSTEHLGIIATGLGFGGPLGMFAMLFHVMNHSLTKALAFCVTGNLSHIYGTRDMRRMGGLVRIAPITAALLAVAIFSLAGVPPLAIFTSEFYTAWAGFEASQYFAVAVYLAGLAIVFFGLVSHFNEVSFGKPNGEVVHGREVGMGANLPLIAFAILICLAGILAPDCWLTLLRNAASEILGS